MERLGRIPQKTELLLFILPQVGEDLE
jgi:hypothetical protein